MKRCLSVAAALVISAQAGFAAMPSARLEARMAYDPKSTHIILFGGLSPTDVGTKLAYDLADTWEWTGIRWVQRYPATTPPRRSSDGMVTDTKRSRVVMFGGRQAATQLNDTWFWTDGNWQQINTANAPPARFLTGMAYDSARDRIVLFGGAATASDQTTVNNMYDTWEFDGTNWTQRNAAGPTVNKPILTYDSARNQLLMLGINDKTETQMYLYNPADGTWTQQHPTTLPGCVQEAGMVFQTQSNTVMETGGVCASSTSTEETFEWDGTNWTKIKPAAGSGNTFGSAIAYDPTRQLVLEFGGVPPFDVPRGQTWAYLSQNWFPITDSGVPSQRSLFSFKADPKNKLVWLYAGINESNTFGDLWSFQNGQWNQVTIPDTGPTGCLGPASAYDTDRQKLVVICSDQHTYEFDGSTWTKIADSKNKPGAFRYRSMVYDPVDKKSILYGGFDGTTYTDETWLWDGTTWTRQKKNPAPARSHTAMWFDPTIKKAVIYGGIGRPTADDRITRYDDMWSFDVNNGWTQITTTTPGPRYGAQVAINPITNKVMLFGGLVVQGVAPTQTQVYSNEFWEWDGANWTKLNLTGPPARENGALEWDPSRQRMTIFGGFAGYYFSDVWTLKDGAWVPDVESLIRRRPGAK